MIGSLTNYLIVNVAIVVPVLVIAALIFSAMARAGAATILRIVARLLLLLAIVALVYDGTRTLAGGSGLVLTSIADHCHTLAPQALEALRGIVIRRLHPAVWDGVFVRVLRLPAWFVLGVVGIVLATIGRKRHRARVFVN